MTPVKNVEKKNITKQIQKHVPHVETKESKTQLEKIVNAQRVPISKLHKNVDPMMIAPMGLYPKEHVQQNVLIPNISILMLAKIVLVPTKEEFQKMLPKLVVNVPLLMLKLLLLLAQRIANAKPTRKLVPKPSHINNHAIKLVITMPHMP